MSKRALVIYHKSLNKPVHDIYELFAYACSEVSDEPAQFLCSIARTVAACKPPKKEVDTASGHNLHFLHTGYGYLRFYPGIENLI